MAAGQRYEYADRTSKMLWLKNRGLQQSELLRFRNPYKSRVGSYGPLVTCDCFWTGAGRLTVFGVVKPRMNLHGPPPGNHRGEETVVAKRARGQDGAPSLIFFNGCLPEVVLVTG